jgi:hypothetical protein
VWKFLELIFFSGRHDYETLSYIELAETAQKTCCELSRNVIGRFLLSPVSLSQTDSLQLLSDTAVHCLLL